jgi:hypothetical protein
MRWPQESKNIKSAPQNPSSTHRLLHGAYHVLHLSSRRRTSGPSPGHLIPELIWISETAAAEVTSTKATTVKAVTAEAARRRANALIVAEHAAHGRTRTTTISSIPVVLPVPIHWCRALTAAARTTIDQAVSISIIL